MAKLLRRPLEIAEILRWARSYREWTGKWPTAIFALRSAVAALGGAVLPASWLVTGPGFHLPKARDTRATAP